MAVHVRPGMGVMVYRFRGIPLLTPVWMDRVTGRLGMWLSHPKIVRSQAILLEDVLGALDA